MIIREHGSMITRDDEVYLTTGRHGFDHAQTPPAREMSTTVVGLGMDSFQYI